MRSARSAATVVGLLAVGFVAAWGRASRPPPPPCVFLESATGFGRVHAAWRSTSPPSPQPYVLSATGYTPIPADRETRAALSAMCADEGPR